MTSQGVVVVVGGGIIGTTHAYWALDNGFDVVHLESDLAARGASVRNFGLVWVGGRAGGPELELALRARELWEVLASTVPEIAFRPAGSLTVGTDERELALMEQAFEREDSAERQWELLDGAEAREVNPELSDAVLGALYCGADAIVEPRAATQAVQAYMAEMRGLQLLARPVVRWSWPTGRYGTTRVPGTEGTGCSCAPVPAGPAWSSSTSNGRRPGGSACRCWRRRRTPGESDDGAG